MKKVILGEKEDNVKYDFRETCFGIIFMNDKYYLTEKNGELSLVGGGVEAGEDHFETLKREAIEEAGLQVLEMKDFITIDCFWHTRDNRKMESLANFYIVKVSDNMQDATEEGSNLVILDENELLEKLSLPYQKKAIELYLQER